MYKRQDTNEILSNLTLAFFKKIKISISQQNINLIVDKCGGDRLNLENELEKINQYNQEILKDLEYQITNSDNVNINQINDEINVVKRVINENKFELEQIIAKLSQMEEINP